MIDFLKNDIKSLIKPLYTKSYITTIISILLFSSLSIYAQNTCQIQIDLKGLRNTNGNVRLAVFNEKDGFPSHIEKAYSYKSFKIPAKNMTIKLSLPEGIYAFSILHDENNDKKMNYNMLGMPKEGYALTDNGTRSIIPTYNNALIKIGKNEVVELEVRYL